jgi:hypothetical protein
VYRKYSFDYVNFLVFKFLFIHADLRYAYEVKQEKLNHKDN